MIGNKTSDKFEVGPRWQKVIFRRDNHTLVEPIISKAALYR